MRRRVLWLIGPMGVGKSTIGLGLHRALGPSSVFVDADQVGLCYPADPEDPQLDRLKARNLGALDFAADTWVVAAGIDTVACWVRYREALPAERVLVYRLRAEAPTLRARIVERGGPLVRLVDAAVDAADALDALRFPDAVVDTTGETVAATGVRVGALLAGAW